MLKQLPIAIAVAALAGCGTAQAPARGVPGYVVSSHGGIVMSGQGACVHTRQWSAAYAVEPCDPVARAAAPAPAPLIAAAEPLPEPALAPAAAAPVAEPAPAPRFVIQSVSISTGLLFGYNRAELTEGGKRKLDELLTSIKDAEVEEIAAVGHADRIASTRYNQKLSEQRAAAVKDYLAQHSAPSAPITAEGKGESRPVTGDACRNMGPEYASNRKLVTCLQPDRRVDIEVFGSRLVAADEFPAVGGESAALR